MYPNGSCAPCLRDCLGEKKNILGNKMFYQPFELNKKSFKGGFT